MPDYDQMSMSEIFKLDASERIKTLNALMIRMEKGAIGPSEYDDAMREAHSLKAAARIVNCAEVQNLAHKMEELLEALKNEIILDNTCVDLFLESLDAMLEMVDAFVAQRSHKVNIQDILSRLEGIKNQGAQGNRGSPSNRTRQGQDSTQRRHSVEKVMVAKQSTDVAVRVGVDRLDRLMNISGEIYTHTLHLERQREFSRQLLDYASHLEHDSMQNALVNYVDKISQLSVNLGLLGVQLRDEIMQTRMLPVATLFEPQNRFVRDLSRASGKMIQLVIEGADTPIDKSILELLKDPLIHLMRNACDHGIESPQDRRNAGKSEEGLITLSAYQKGDRIILKVKDDGHGIDVEAIKAKIAEKNLIPDERIKGLTAEEALEFIFLPGFSTAREVTTISGRGIGMDVVKTKLASIGGQCHVETKKGEFTCISVSLPLTLIVLKSLLVRVGKEIFAIPIARVEEVLMCTRDELKQVEGRETISLRGDIVPLVNLCRLWDFDIQQENIKKWPLVVIGQGEQRVAFLVDEFLEEKEIVSNSLDKRLGKWRDLCGATVLDNGQVGFIVDVDSLLQSSGEYTGKAVITKDSHAKVIKRKRILVVEDSLTVRELEKKVLQNNGYEVQVAVDGLDGFNKVKESKFDLIVTDIEMPRMDGFELITLLKRDKELRDIPTVIVSFKERDEDRRRGIEVGADKYITKSKYDDAILLDTVAKLIG